MVELRWRTSPDLATLCAEGVVVAEIKVFQRPVRFQRRAQSLKSVFFLVCCFPRA